MTFGLDGHAYEIDLSTDNADKLRSVLEEYAGSARQTARAGHNGRRRSASSPRATAGSGVDSKAVRAWAAENHIEVSNRGRLPATLVARFRDAGH